MSIYRENSSFKAFFETVILTAQGMNTIERSRLPYVFCVLLQSFFYALCNPLTKIAYESVSPLLLLTIRFLIASLLCVLLFGKRTLCRVREVRITEWLWSALCCAGAFIAGNLALEHASATNVSFIISLSFLFTPFLSRLLLHRRLRLSQFIVQAATAFGLFLLCCNDGSFTFGFGELLALLNALCLAGFLTFGERAMQKMDAWSITTLQICIALLFCTIFLLFSGESIQELSRISLKAWLIILYQVVFCTLIAYALQNISVRHLSATTVSALQCTQPIMSAMLSSYLLGEVLTRTGLLGAGIIVIGLLCNAFLSETGKAGV